MLQKKLFSCLLVTEVKVIELVKSNNKFVSSCCYVVVIVMLTVFILQQLGVVSLVLSYYYLVEIVLLESLTLQQVNAVSLNSKVLEDTNTRIVNLPLIFNEKRTRSSEFQVSHCKENLDTVAHGRQQSHLDLHATVTQLKERKKKQMQQKQC